MLLYYRSVAFEAVPICICHGRGGGDCGLETLAPTTPSRSNRRHPAFPRLACKAAFLICCVRMRAHVAHPCCAGVDADVGWHYYCRCRRRRQTRWGALALGLGTIAPSRNKRRQSVFPRLAFLAAFPVCIRMIAPMAYPCCIGSFRNRKRRRRRSLARAQRIRRHGDGGWSIAIDTCEAVAFCHGCGRRSEFSSDEAGGGRHGRLRLQ